MIQKFDKTLIVFEGHDGSGKTTMVNMLCKSLKDQGYNVMSYYSIIPKFSGIREIINNYNDIELSFWYYTISVLMSVYEALLSDNDIIIFDRYIYSTIVSHHVRGYACNRKEIENFFPVPDIVFYLDTNLDVLTNRIHNRNNEGKNSPHDFYVINDRNLYEKVNNEYIKFDFTKVDANGESIKTHELIFDLVIAYLTSKSR